MQDWTIGEAGIACETCGKPTKTDRVNVTMWLGGELNVIEDVPAYVCENCQSQYFDTETEERIRKLAAAGFPRWQAVREMSVAVFSVYGPKAAKAVATPIVGEDVA